MMHPHTQVRYIGDAIGYGVFATQPIAKGTVVYVKDPLELEITPQKYKEYDPVLQETIEKYSYMDENGVRIMSWDHAKYVNHCCQCNTMSTGYGFEIAIRDIAAGEEITDEYGMFNFEYEMALVCQKPYCRMRVTGRDLDVYFQEWDGKVQQALQQFQNVEQLLLPLIDPVTKSEVEAYLQNPVYYKSVFSLRHSQQPHTFSANGI